MKKNIKIIVFILTFTIIVVGSGIFFYFNNSTKKELVINDLINISKLPKKFMDNYFEEYSELKQEDKENMLIVISSEKITDGYGATKIIEGPNNRYYLVYNNNVDKMTASYNLEKESFILSVDENTKKEAFVDALGDNYNSWGIKAIGLDYAKTLVSSITPADVTVAIIDTGCDMDLFNKYYSGKIVETYNVLANDDSMFDNVGHGTHIAGTIAEGTPDNVKILPVKASDNRYFEDVDILTAIDYITYYEKADVINMSFGGYTYTEAEYQAIEAANAKNIICVAAAGNESTSAYSYPASFDNTISIASINSDLSISDFSNYGDKITFAAPGGDIKSLMASYMEISSGIDGDDDHETISGTSMATPHAAAAVAVLKSFNKNLTMDNVIEELKEYAIDLGSIGYDIYYGNGVINFNGAIACTAEMKTCDKYGVFKVLDPTGMNVDAPILTNYNYGSLNNILGTIVNFNEIDGYSYEKKLWELDGANISGYDPYSSDTQTVTVEYLDLETTFEVTNPSNYESGWSYEQVDNKYYLTEYKDSNLNIGKLYFPEEIDGFTMDGLIDTGPGHSYYRMFFNSDDSGNFKEIILPANIHYIGSLQFNGLQNVRKVISYADELEVSEDSFGSMSNLLEFDGTVLFSEESNNVFKGDENLKIITLSNNNTKIPRSTFYGCTALKNINLPDSIIRISENAFAYSGLSSVVLPINLEYIGDNAFFDSKLTSINIPAKVEHIGTTAFGRTQLTTITVDSNNHYYDSRKVSNNVDSNVIIETATNKIIQGSIYAKIPDSVLVIGEKSFSELSTIEIDIPEGVTTIEPEAFSGCLNLDKVTLPNSVVNIDSSSFLYSGVFRMFTTFWVHNNSYAHNYVLENNKTYIIIEDSSGAYAREIMSIAADLNKLTYHPGDRVDFMKIKYSYMDFATLEYKEVYVDDYTIRYQNGDSFSEGDESFNYVFNIEHSLQNIQGTVNTIRVVPKNTEVELPVTNVVRGDFMCQYDFPDGVFKFEFCITFDEPGEHSVTGSYIPNDTGVAINDVDAVFNVVDKEIVSECANLYNSDGVLNIRAYDGTTDINLDNVKLCQLEETDYTVISASLESPEINEQAGVTVRIRLDDDTYEQYAFSGNKQESEFIMHIEVYRPYKIPTIKNDRFVYDGTEHIIEFNDFDDEVMVIDTNSQISAVNAGIYVVYINLIDGPYRWEDGQKNTIASSFLVEQAEANIEYSSSDTVVNYDGQGHGINLNVLSPEVVEIKYKDNDGEYTLDEMPLYSIPGTYTVYYRIHSDDNHKDVFGSNNVVINESNIVNNSTDYEGVYDGLEHSININVSIDSYSIKYSINSTKYDLDELPKFKEVGEYTVNYKITSDGYDDIEGSNKVKIYGIRKIDSSVELKDNKFIIKNNSFGDLKEKISIYSTSTTYNHYDKDNNLVDSDVIKTGDFIEFKINNLKTYEYQISVLGDIDGNGTINSQDLLRIRWHLLGTKQLSDVYYMAANIDSNDIVNSQDLLRIRWHLLGTKKIS